MKINHLLDSLHTFPKNRTFTVYYDIMILILWYWLLIYCDDDIPVSTELFLLVYNLLQYFNFRIKFQISLIIIPILLLLLSESSSEESVISIPSILSFHPHSLFPPAMIIRISKLSIIKLINFLKHSIQFVDSLFNFQHSHKILFAHRHSIL
jgi:hypothetical protein